MRNSISLSSYDLDLRLQGDARLPEDLFLYVLNEPHHVVEGGPAPPRFTVNVGFDVKF
jgi:hypothetical protein